jgi:O-antigen ligase
MLIAVVLTQSMGAIILGIPAGIITVILLIWWRKARLIIAISVVTGIIAVFGLSQMSPHSGSLLDLSTGTNFIRLRVWESSLEIIRDHPLTGLGLDQFLYAFRGHYIRPDAIFDPDLSHPHNFVLDFWIRLGLPGVLLLVSMQSVFWRNLLSAYKHVSRFSVSGLIIIGTMGSMANLLVHGLVDNSIYVDDLVYVFALLMVVAGWVTNGRAIDVTLKE